jgi:hypothetical protein
MTTTTKESILAHPEKVVRLIPKKLVQAYLKDFTDKGYTVTKEGSDGNKLYTVYEWEVGSEIIFAAGESNSAYLCRIDTRLLPDNN